MCLDQIQCGQSRRAAGSLGPQLSLVCSMGPSPDGSNDHNHASIKMVIKLGVRVWEKQGV